MKCITSFIDTVEHAFDEKDVAGFEIFVCGLLS